MNITKQNISLPNGRWYDSTAYPNSGVFIVSDANAFAINNTTQSSIAISQCVAAYVNKSNNIVLYLDDEQSFINNCRILDQPKNEQIQSPNSVSEELFLKAMSLIVNKDESYKN